MRNAILVLSLSSVVGVLSFASECGAQTRRSATRFVGSYDDAMNVPVNYDFRGATSAGGLGRSDLDAPLRRAIPRFVRCVAQEQSRGGELEQVQVRIAVGSDGRVMGASVDQGSEAFRRCSMTVVRSLRWRAFTGPRLGFTWGFSVE